MDRNDYYVVRKKAVPEVLLKVCEAKKLLESCKVTSVIEATEAVGLSRSSFYKYKDDIFPLKENVIGRTVTFVAQIKDEPGELFAMLNTIAEYKANVLTIHQTIPINGVASLTISVEISANSEDSSEMFNRIEDLPGVMYLKILAKN